MKFKLNILFLIILILLIIFSKSDPEHVTVTAKTGIINREISSDKKSFSFDVECEVNQNITNNLTKKIIILEVTKERGSTDIIEAECNIKPVRVYEEQKSLTNLMCLINLVNIDINENTKLFINSITSESNIFQFKQFNTISDPITIGTITLNYTEDDDECKNNNYIFEIIVQNDIGKRPLQAMICYIPLYGDSDHKEARCVVPFIGKIMKCSVDVAEKKYTKESKISIKKTDLIQCKNGQNLELQYDAENELAIKEECGEIINNRSYFIYFKFSILFVFNLLLI